jgi:SAM-dependent methyltransferase
LEYGREQGWVVTAEPSADARFRAGVFDVVTMIELLEHIPDPDRLLRDAADWLAPGGLLYITTPNVRSLNGRILRLDWTVVSPPEHVILWTASALRRALAGAGLQVVRVRAEGCNPSEILSRLGRNRRREWPINRDESGRALSETFSRTRFRRAMKSAINEGLNALNLGDTLKAWAQRAA